MNTSLEGILQGTLKMHLIPSLLLPRAESLNIGLRVPRPAACNAAARRSDQPAILWVPQKMFPLFNSQAQPPCCGRASRSDFEPEAESSQAS